MDVLCLLWLRCQVAQCTYLLRVSRILSSLHHHRHAAVGTCLKILNKFLTHVPALPKLSGWLAWLATMLDDDRLAGGGRLRQPWLAASCSPSHACPGTRMKTQRYYTRHCLTIQLVIEASKTQHVHWELFEMMRNTSRARREDSENTL